MCQSLPLSVQDIDTTPKYFGEETTTAEDAFDGNEESKEKREANALHGTYYDRYVPGSGHHGGCGHNGGFYGDGHQPGHHQDGGPYSGGHYGEEGHHHFGK